MKKNHKNEKEIDTEQLQYEVLSGIIGVAIGDAMGVPHEFKERELFDKNPVISMNGYGTHSKPPGTWSDDTALTLCLAESLCKGLDYNDIGNEFIRWLYYGKGTHDGKLPFDVGRITAKAISTIKIGMTPIMAGMRDKNSNGNGSLMRILPIAYYLKDFKYNDEKFKIIEDISSMTHGHIVSRISCSIYIELAINILKGFKLSEAYTLMQNTILSHYEQEIEISVFDRILKSNIATLDRDEIRSSGYVLDTLEASMWCLINSENFFDGILKAINLGGDTDTIGAVSGGLLGIYYGYDSIPKKWINTIVKKDEIADLCIRYANSLV